MVFSYFSIYSYRAKGGREGVGTQLKVNIRFTVKTTVGLRYGLKLGLTLGSRVRHVR